MSFDGIACATCHPDGGEDGLTWSTPDGQRQTPMLRGRLIGTEPYGWSRDQKTLPKYIESTISRLGGRGLADGELAALATYLGEVDAPPVPEAKPSEVEAGLAAFKNAGCGTCHAGGTGVDHESHKVGGPQDEAFDTPSLRYVGLTAPYFHDGRYRTLEDVLVDPRSTMGSTAKLSFADRKAIVRYLGSL
jgi:hypothetical protein